jgi:hypothetical protein
MPISAGQFRFDEQIIPRGAMWPTALWWRPSFASILGLLANTPEIQDSGCQPSTDFFSLTDLPHNEALCVVLGAVGLPADDW